MDNASSAGDAGFDAALKALDELESPVASAAPSIGVAPLAIDIADARAPAKPIVADPPATAAGDDLESAVNASMAKVTTAAVEPAPIPAASAPVKPGRLWLFAMAVAGLGVFASLLSVVGLVVTSRTVASASLVVADARERQAQMAKAGVLLHDLDLIRTRQIELLQRQQVAAETTPLSGEQFNKSMDNLRIDIGKRGPDADIIRTLHEGQADTNQRINELSMKVMRIEAAVGGAR